MVPSLLVGGGVFGVLALVIGLLLRWSASDRRDYQATLRGLRGELAAARSVAEDEMETFRSQLAAVESERDAERGRRRAAEDTAAAVVDTLREEIRGLRDEVATLRRQLGMAAP